MGGMEVQAVNLNRTAKTKRRGKGRTDALQDVMGVEDSFKHEWNFLYKTRQMARRLATLWQGLSCGLVDQQEVARVHGRLVE